MIADVPPTYNSLSSRDFRGAMGIEVETKITIDLSKVKFAVYLAPGPPRSGARPAGGDPPRQPSLASHFHTLVRILDHATIPLETYFITGGEGQPAGCDSADVDGGSNEDSGCWCRKSLTILGSISYLTHLYNNSLKYQQHQHLKKSRASRKRAECPLLIGGFFYTHYHGPDIYDKSRNKPENFDINVATRIDIRTFLTATMKTYENTFVSLSHQFIHIMYKGVGNGLYSKGYSSLKSF
ncbi:hypothetical protein GWI33_013889 [Rhynchophorus ferrugineus]|uniref:Uncharacterized protein n=1 Tax=Rhynchophorus ferrugineus TaxID=354439 RepID=A0A834M7E8_RHYFE|nr:hypothetical protein GWI33_013889 [Rhynchophorus ferrugineus]